MDKTDGGMTMDGDMHRDFIELILRDGDTDTERCLTAAEHGPFRDVTDALLVGLERRRTCWQDTRWTDVTVLKNGTQVVFAPAHAVHGRA